MLFYIFKNLINSCDGKAEFSVIITVSCVMTFSLQCHVIL